MKNSTKLIVTPKNSPSHLSLLFSAVANSKTEVLKKEDFFHWKTNIYIIYGFTKNSSLLSESKKRKFEEMWFLSLSLPLSLYLSLSFSIYLSISLSFFISLYFCLSLSLTFSLILILSSLTISSYSLFSPSLHFGFRLFR